MVLKEVRDKGKHQKLLFKIIIEKDSFFISTKCRDHKEPILIDIGSIVSSYVDKETMEKMKATCKLIYKQKTKELF